MTGSQFAQRYGWPAFAAWVLVFAPGAGAGAETAKPRHDFYYADSTPNIAGFWRPEFRPAQFDWIVDGKKIPSRDKNGQLKGLPYKPQWLAIYDARQKSSLEGKPYGDPHYNCWPRGPVSEYTSGNATMELTQTPGRVQQIFQEDTQLRNFYTDGRKMPEGADPASPRYEPKMNGYSIGHWEGKTLVTHTRGVRKELTLGLQAPHSDVMDVTERFTRTDATHLMIDVIVADEKALAKPIETHLPYKIDPNGEFEDEFCTENNINSTDKDGYVQTIIDYRRSTAWDVPED